MQPLDPNKAPKVHEPALNHIGLWIDDLKACVEYLVRKRFISLHSESFASQILSYHTIPTYFSSQTAKGVRFTPGGIRKGAAGYDVCFIHPKGNDAFPIGSCGVLVELVQAPPEVIAAKK